MPVRFSLSKNMVFQQTGYQHPPIILRISGRRVLQGVKFTAHVAEFDGFMRMLVLRSLRACVCNALMLLVLYCRFRHADFFDKLKRLPFRQPFVI